MKKNRASLAIFLLVFITSCGTLLANNKDLKLDSKDSIYYSFSSSCSVYLKIIKNKEAIIENNGIEKKGILIKNKKKTNFLDFKSGKNKNFTFYFQNSDVVIFNKKNELNCKKTDSIVLERLGNDNQALSRIKHYAKKNDAYLEDSEAMNQKSLFFEKQKFYKTAIYILKQITEKNPKNADAFLRLGDAYWESDKEGDAKKKYLIYIQLMKDDNKPYKSMAKRAKERTLN